MDEELTNTSSSKFYHVTILIRSIKQSVCFKSQSEVNLQTGVLQLNIF